MTHQPGFDLQMVQRLLPVFLSIGLILFGVRGLVVGIAKVGSGLSLESVIGFNIGLMFVGVCILAFLLFGRKNR